MSSDQDDVDKLLGQIKLQNFPYRAFGRGEPSALRIVPKLEGAVPPAQPASAAKTAAAITAATPAASTIRPAAAQLAAPAQAPAPLQPAMRIGEAFERLARVSASTGAPRLQLQLNLPRRPALIATTVSPSERRLQDVFERLRCAALPGLTQAHVGSGS